MSVSPIRKDEDDEPLNPKLSTNEGNGIPPSAFWMKIFLELKESVGAP